MGICYCKLCQPNLPSISDEQSLYTKSGGKIDSPVIEVLELLHDQVYLAVIVVGGEVVHPAAEALACIKETIKPFEIPTSRGRTYKNLAIFNFPNKIPSNCQPYQDIGSESQSRLPQPPLETCPGP